MENDGGTDGVLFINFGEPSEPREEDVVAYLERIFLANAVIESPESAEAARSRSAELARRRAPALLEEYRRIGGSPLNSQAAEQAMALSRELEARGSPAHVERGMQYTRPTIREAADALQAKGVERVALLPAYPLCGPSTTVASLREARAAFAAANWDAEIREITGWHRHPGYVELRASSIAETARQAGVDLHDERVELVFSAHGTPMKYVRAGSRYVRYVEDWCNSLAARLGLAGYTLGYQNHSNRGVEWTRPDIDAAIGGLADDRECVVVEAVSFMHEQSETLAELDIDLREEAEGRGLRFVRVPVPHDAAEFASILADLVEAAWGDAPATLPALRSCQCRPGADVCLNGDVRAG